MGENDPAGQGEGLLNRIGAILALDPDAQALEFEGEWYTWGDISGIVESVADAVEQLSLPRGSQIGVLLRNRPASIGLMLGVLCAGGCVVVLNPHLGAERVGADLETLDLALIVGESADVAAMVSSQQRERSACLEIDEISSPARLATAPPRDPGELREGVAVRLLTSGTTGPPKRVELTFDMFERVLLGAKHYESDQRSELRLRQGVVVVNSPLVHLGGIFRVLQAVSDGRRMSLLERFTVEGWVASVRRHRPRTASLVPAALRMVLDADLDQNDLSSLRSVISGTAPLSPEVAEAFTDRYGVPVLTNYAATEFGGAVAGWTLPDHQLFWNEKRGSVGRAHPGCRLRIIDASTGDELAADEVGLLEVRASQLPHSGWIRTTDLARLDADGFLWIAGRADQTIIRGGLKVQPDTVRAALERHPGVRAAAVVGVDDERLGQVPVAVVELTSPDTVDVAALLEHASKFLARYEVPVEVRFVDVMPRTVSAKVDLREVRALVSGAETDRGGA